MTPVHGILYEVDVGDTYDARGVQCTWRAIYVQTDALSSNCAMRPYFRGGAQWLLIFNLNVIRCTTQQSLEQTWSAK
jgi:hypothetical protein